MKKLLLLGALTALTGCVSNYPQSAQELRSFTSSSSLAGSSSQVVARSYSSTRSVLRRLSAQCYNQTVTNTQAYRHGRYGPQYVTTRMNYTSKVTTSGNRSTLAVRYKQPGNKIGKAITNEPENGYVGFVVDATPAAGGTKVTIFGASSFFGGRAQAKAVVESIETGSINCPNL